MQSDIKEQVEAIVADGKRSAAEKEAELNKLYEYARSEQRTASESMMVDDDGLNDALREIELGLERIGASGQFERDDKSAATL